RNRREPDAMTVVSHETFVESRPVNRGVIVVARDRLDAARVVGATARVAPDRRSVLAQPAVVEIRRPPMYVMTRQVVVQRQPPPPSAAPTARAAQADRPGGGTRSARTARTSTAHRASAEATAAAAERATLTSGAGERRTPRTTARERATTDTYPPGAGEASKC